MKTEIIVIFEKEEDKNKIIDRIRNFEFNDLPKHFHLEFSIMEKLTDLDLLRRTFSKFDLIKTIELRENELKQRYYSLNYEVGDGTFVVISISFEKEKPFILNAFHAKRSYKQFEKSLRKNYSDRFV